jgi:hypothetical protein
MKFRNLFILSLFFLGFLILFFCKSETVPTELQSKEDIVVKIAFSDELKAELSDEDMTKHKGNLADTIIRFRDKLIELFHPENGDRNYKEMGSLLAQRGAILEDSREDYTWLYGIEEIAGLFQKLPEGRLEFEIRHVFIDKIFDQRFEDGEEVDMVARIFFKYRVPREEEGKLKNQAGGGTFGCLHRYDCPWCDF